MAASGSHPSTIRASLLSPLSQHQHRLCDPLAQFVLILAIKPRQARAKLLKANILAIEKHFAHDPTVFVELRVFDRDSLLVDKIAEVLAETVPKA